MEVEKKEPAVDETKRAPTIQCVIKEILDAKLHEANRINWSSAGFDLLRTDHFTMTHSSLQTIYKALPDTFLDCIINVCPGVSHCEIKAGAVQNTVEVTAWGCSSFSWVFWQYQFSAFKCTLRYPRPGYVFTELPVSFY